MGRGLRRNWIGNVAAFTLFALLASLNLQAQTKAAPKKAPPAAPKRPAAAPKSNPEADLTALKALGIKSAPITMEVFSDYQCPACRELYATTVRPVIDNYVSAGKVYLIHRDIPLPNHQHSREAARYANAAARLRKMEPVVQALYGKQDVWSVDGNIDGIVASVLTPAEMKQVRQIVRSGTLDANIDKDVQLAGQFRVTQTPTTIITYKGQTYPVVGVVSYNMLKTFFEQLLRQ